MQPLDANIIAAFDQLNKHKLCAWILSKFKKVVDNLANLSNIKPIILDVNTMLDVTSSSFDDFDNFFLN